MLSNNYEYRCSLLLNNRYLTHAYLHLNNLQKSPGSAQSAIYLTINHALVVKTTKVFIYGGEKNLLNTGQLRIIIQRDIFSLTAVSSTVKCRIRHMYVLLVYVLKVAACTILI